MSKTAKKIGAFALLFIKGLGSFDGYLHSFSIRISFQPPEPIMKLFPSFHGVRFLTHKREEMGMPVFGFIFPRFKELWIVGLAVRLFLNADAAVLLEEHFNYSNGNLGDTGIGDAVWAGGDSAHAAIRVTNTAALEYSGLSGAAESGVVFSGGTFKKKAAAFTSQNSGTVYCSFLLNIQTAPSTVKAFVYLQNGNSASSFPPLGIFLNGNVVGLAKYASSPAVNSSALGAGTHLVVARYTFQSGNDPVDLWIDPTSLGDNDNIPSATLTTGTGSSSDASALSYIFLNHAASQTLWVDEVRVGTSWADVTPTSGVVSPMSHAPYITQALMTDDGLVLSGTNGSANAAYVIMSATNVTLPQWQWTPIASNSFDADGNFKWTNAVSLGVDRKFYQLWVGAAPPPIPTAPTITAQPQDQTVFAGQNVTFNVVADGTAPLSYQWYFNTSIVLTGETSTNLTLNNVQTNDAGGYSVVVTNIAGSVTSVVATLTVSNLLAAPWISTQPQSQTVTAGQSISFIVVANGTLPLSYQWYFNTNTLLTDATNDTLTLNNVQTNDAGGYSMIVTNDLGSVTSVVATLTVKNAINGSTNLFPVNGAVNVCVDTPLKITFDSAPTLGTSGQIRIYNADTLTLFDSVDISSTTQSKKIGGTTYNYYPVLISGKSAYVSLHSNLLYGQTYYVNVDSNVFQNSGSWTGISDTNSWRLTTKPTEPSSDTTNIVVIADGSGDFCTVQGAIDFVPSGNTTWRWINIRNGIYREIVYNNARSNLVFLGQDRNQTIITYANNNNLNSGTSVRSLFRTSGNDIIMENLTLTNSTPQGGSQAEALRVDGLRFIFYNGNLYSLQDTILVNSSGSQGYFQDSLVAGNVDYVWGLGTMYFTNCEIRSIARGSSPNGFNCQPRTASGYNGIAYVNCRLTVSDNSVQNQYLARNNKNESTPYDQAVYINCMISINNYNPVGWYLDGSSSTANLRFWEYQSTDLTGTNLVDVSQRPSWSKQLSDSEAANVRDVSIWFSGWVPQVP